VLAQAQAISEALKKASASAAAAASSAATAPAASLPATGMDAQSKMKLLVDQIPTDK
jgi:hypothetical protein